MKSLNSEEKIMESWKKNTIVPRKYFVAPPLAFITARILWGMDLTINKQYSSAIWLQLSLIAVDMNHFLLFPP